MFSFAPYNKIMFSVLVILSEGGKKCCPKVWMLSMERRQLSSYTSVSSHREWNRWENSICSQWSSSHNWIREAVGSAEIGWNDSPSFVMECPCQERYGRLWEGLRSKSLLVVFKSKSKSDLLLSELITNLPTLTPQTPTSNRMKEHQAGINKDKFDCKMYWKINAVEILRALKA